MDGTLTITGNGGAGNYQYSIDGGTTFQSSGSFNGLAAGNYNIVVEDAFGCQGTGTETVGSSGGGSIVNINSSNPSCNGVLDGTISITANSGGNPPLQYSIDGGATFQSSSNFSGLSGGVYPIVVQDNIGCQITSSVTLVEPAAITFTNTLTHPLCNGDNNGSIIINASGGNGSLQYSIDGGTNFQVANTFNNLSSGNYNLVIQDANNCQITGNATLNNPALITFTNSSNNETCGNANGIIVGSGGTGSLQYSIDGGANFRLGFYRLTGFTYSIIRGRLSSNWIRNSFIRRWPLYQFNQYYRSIV